MTEASDRLYEQLLVLRFRAGDEAGFAELVGRYHDRLQAYVRRLAVDDGRIDDVLQEVWLSVFRNISSLRRPRSLRRWLYRITRNAPLKKLGRQRDLVGLDVWAHAGKEPVEDHPDFSPADIATMQTCLERLSPPHREVLALRFLDDLSYEDIADVIQRPIGTVRSRLHYAKGVLRRKMRGDSCQTTKR